MKSYLLVLSVFAVACGSAEKEDTDGDITTQPSSEPASAPTSSPTSEPEGGEIMLYNTSLWSGEWTVAEGALTGTENWLYSGWQESPEVRNCDYAWDLAGAAPAAAECEDCVWEFEVTATGNADASTLNSEDCALEDAVFTYAYTTDYMYEGESMGEALLYKSSEAEAEIGAFVLPGNPNSPQVETYTSEINWDETAGTFSYASGTVDYEYLYQY